MDAQSYFIYFTVVTTVLLNVLPVNQAAIHPIILIPGLQGCQLQGKLKSRVPMSDETIACKANTDDWFTIWTHIDSFIPVDCWINNMRLIYNRSSRVTHNIPGVLIQPSDFGGTSSVETLAALPLIDDQIYMKPLVEQFVHKLNYIRGVNIRSAPYDFRKAPNEQQAWMKQLKFLIEQTYHLNGNISIDLIAHSMGGMFTYIFLTKQSLQWKNQFIHQFISISTPYGGSVSAVKTILTGFNVGIIPLKDKQIHSLELSYPIVPFLLPSTISWSPDSTLVDVASLLNVTVNNYQHLFQLLSLPDVSEMYLDVKNLMNPFVHPGVNVTCIYSTGKKTPGKIIYQSPNHFPSSPHILYEDGDGTVNRQSLEACLKWSNDNSFTFNIRNFHSLPHAQILKAPEIIDALVSLIAEGSEHL